MVVGARAWSGQAGVGRGLANGFYNRMASWMTGHKVLDLTSGFRAVRADKFREFLHLLPNGFSYPTTSTMAFFPQRLCGGLRAHRRGQTRRQEPHQAAARRRALFC
ncbi:glycosyl transferase family 2 [mine drainage metagenome]|uniref:Glycosyl transferase family 2 n=1 Tax=mine drainage metagenome TaxID=410659 RepID=T1BWY2_9ZZZZ